MSFAMGPAERAAVRSIDAGVVERIAAGDLRALALAYDQHHARVRAFAQRMLGSADAAEDVVQEVFVDLPRAARRYRGDGSLASYLIGVAARKCQRTRRSAWRRERAYDRLARQPPDAVSGPDPEQRAELQDLARRLAQALPQLSFKLRAVFVLAVVEERTASEVAEILNIPEGTVRTRVFHARKKLRALLKEQGP